jgi:hypothetical protein
MMRFSLSKSNQKVSRRQRLNPEPFCRRPEILDVVCHNCIGLAIERNTACWLNPIEETARESQVPGKPTTRPEPGFWTENPATPRTPLINPSRDESHDCTLLPGVYKTLRRFVTQSNLAAKNG